MLSIEYLNPSSICPVIELTFTSQDILYQLPLFHWKDVSLSHSPIRTCRQWQSFCKEFNLLSLHWDSSVERYVRSEINHTAGCRCDRTEGCRCGWTWPDLATHLHRTAPTSVCPQPTPANLLTCSLARQTAPYLLSETSHSTWRVKNKKGFSRERSSCEFYHMPVSK